jgi:hypothetical protein
MCRQGIEISNLFKNLPGKTSLVNGFLSKFSGVLGILGVANFFFAKLTVSPCKNLRYTEPEEHLLKVASY